MAIGTMTDRRLVPDPGVPVRGFHAMRNSLAPLAAGLMMRAGLPVINEQSRDPQERAEQELAAEAGRRYTGMGLMDVARELSYQQGGGREIREPSAVLQRAMSGGALTNIFTAVFNAQLVQSYNESPDSTIGWVREGQSRDFMTIERPILDKVGNLSPHARGGTADHVTWGDSVERYQIGRYSGQFKVDDMDIIDDRFDALLGAAIELGAAARRLRPDLVYAILLANANLGADSKALFHADHGNLGDAVLDAEGIQAGIVAVAKQTKNAVNLNLRPRFLIVPQDLSFAGQILLQSAQRISLNTGNGTFNPLLNELIELRTENRIGVGGVVDPASGTVYPGTATNWFLATDPAQCPSIEVAYLDNQRQPTIRSYELSQGRWGIGWDVKMDIGAKALEYKGIYKSSGDAVDDGE